MAGQIHRANPPCSCPRVPESEALRRFIGACLMNQTTTGTGKIGINGATPRIPKSKRYNQIQWKTENIKILLTDKGRNGEPQTRRCKVLKSYALNPKQCFGIRIWNFDCCAVRIT